MDDFDIDPFSWELKAPCLSVAEMPGQGLPGAGPDFRRYAAGRTELGDAQAKYRAIRRGNDAEKAAARQVVAAEEAKLGRILDRAYRLALYRRGYRLTVEHKGRSYIHVPWLSGGPWGAEKGAVGPAPWVYSDVMVIGKHPGVEEVRTGKNFVGYTSEQLKRALRHCRVPPDVANAWYLTNLVKFDRPDGGGGELPKAWVDDCKPLLWLELMLLRPRFVLCLGAEAIKALLGPGYGVANMVGRMVPLTFRAVDQDRRRAAPWAEVRFDQLTEHTAIVMGIVHPAYVSNRPAAFDDLASGVGKFWDLVQSRIEVVEQERDVRHQAVYGAQALAHIVDRVRARPGDLTVAFDAEWHGKHWNDEDAYLRTIQFSPAPKESYCVVLAEAGGAPAFRPGHDAAIAELRRLVSDKPDGVVRVGGHGFRADLPWLLSAGLDLRPFFAVPPGWDPQVMPRGLDTLYLAHAVFEAMETFKLEPLAMRHTTCPRWDVKLQAWKAQYCKEHSLRDKDLEGYGDCPAAVLIPYSNYDADATRRLIDILWGYCIVDDCGRDSRHGYLNSLEAYLGFLEMEMVGIVVDQERADTLIALYAEKAAILREHLQTELRWPDFNPASSFQRCEFLFGEALNGTRDKVTGRPKVLRPEAAVPPLRLRPVKTTSKPAKQWDQVAADGTASRYNPSSDKEVLGMLANEHPEYPLIGLLRDVRFLGSVCTTILRPPKPPKGAAKEKPARRKAAAGPEFVFIPSRGGRGAALGAPARPAAAPPEVDEEEAGDDAYDGGLVYYKNDDGRVRSHFYVAKTGRATSSRPNLQNISQQRDATYRRILGYRDDQGAEAGDYLKVFGGPCYKYPIRTILRAAPGCALVGFDLRSAEIAMLAWQSDDAVMLDDVRRAMLPDGHPDQVDLHVLTAREAFNLDCPPTKKGLAALKLSHLRTPAKNVRFGVPYMRGAGAIARQCREQGHAISTRDAQRLIDGWHARYPDGSRFLRACQERPINPGWMTGPYLRHRRFAATDDYKALEEMKREACNFTIQNGVADMISLALGNIMRYREANKGEGDFRVVLQIHDALLFEVSVPHIPWVLDRVIPECVVSVPVIPRDLDGGDTILRGRPPYHFDVEPSLYVNWGEELTGGPERDRLLQEGLDEKYLPPAGA